ncbi:MAG TPA: dihydrodipicolinate synthase family protein [Pirellulales bacterium]|jgi:4-hydroxy-tetrahydrodipicolinate synthase
MWFAQLRRHLEFKEIYQMATSTIPSVGRSIKANEQQPSKLPRPLRGMIPPMLTPLAFDKAGNEQVDIAGLERLIEHILGGGVHGLFILGSTGEGPSLSERFKRELIEQSARIVNRRVPLLVGITDSSFTDSLALAAHAAAAGADAVVCTSPFYFPISDAEHLAYFRKLNSQLPLPLFLYNMPGLTKVRFALDVIKALRDEPNVVGLKDSSGDMAYFKSALEIAAGRPDWTMLVGPERLLTDVVAAGAHGGVCAEANLHPQLLVELYDAAVARDAGRISAARSKMAKLLQLYQLQTNIGRPGIAPLKAALAYLGICQDQTAPPLVPLDPSHRGAVQEIVNELGLTRSI